MASLQTAKEVPVREIEGKIQLAQRVREQVRNVLDRTGSMRSRLLGVGEVNVKVGDKPEPVRSEIAELEHTLVEVQDALNTVQLHLNDLERI